MKLQRLTKYAACILALVYSTNALAAVKYEFIGNCNEKLVLEHAASKRQILRGLSHRKHMEHDHGMLFIYQKSQPLRFWMKDTHIPLDIIFLDDEMVVREIHHNNQPFDLTKVKSEGHMRYALELNGGFAKKCDLKVGDVLKRKR